ncbi:MAG TPA: acetyl-CoA carboxylase biotin carboxyl carrier protein [Planctomycetota bacterium]
MDRLLALLKKGELTELEYEHRGTKLRLSRQAAPSAPGPYMVHAGAPVAAAPVAAAPVPASPADGVPQAPVEDAGIFVVRAPMVGSFYRSANPESDPFVQVGDRVGDDTTLCILEAMKVMNEIKAECAGEVVEVMVENGEPVEYGQAMFRIRTA